MDHQILYKKQHPFSTIFLLNLLVYTLFVCSNLCQAESDGKEPSLEQLYDWHSQDYDALVAKTHYQGPLWVARKKELLQPDMNTILDLGCADGNIGRLLLSFNPNYQISGVDFSNGMVQACKRKGGYQKVIRADLSEGLPPCLLGKTYDIVFALGCLEFIEHHDCLFQQIYCILPSKGQFWLTLQANSEEIIDVDVMKAYSERDIQNILEEYGFRILDIEFQKAGYIRSFDKKEVPYFFVIAEAMEKASF